jgi:uncharacterized protein (TIGR03083 family)
MRDTTSYARAAEEIPMDTTPDRSRTALEQAAAFFLATVERVEPAQWDRPGLGEWSVRDLVGHTGRAFLTVETYLGQPAAAVDLPTGADYVVTALAAHGDPAGVAQRGREAGAALGSDPTAATRVIVSRVLGLVAAADDSRLVATPVGGMRLVDYLPTRIFELVVHTLDLAAAIGVAAEPPAAASRVALHLIGEIVVRTGKAAPVLLSLTGRGPLPAGFGTM